jgi:hypothetical protein
LGVGAGKFLYEANVAFRRLLENSGKLKLHVALH